MLGVLNDSCERKATRKNLNVLISLEEGTYFLAIRSLCLHVFVYQEVINFINIEFVFIGTGREPCNLTLLSDYPVSSNYF